MSQFLESILLTDGVFPLLAYHQARVNQTIADHNGISLSLLSYIEQTSLPTSGVFKFRIVYDLNGNAEWQCLPYRQKLITSLQCIDIGEYSYEYKFADRSSIQNFYSQKKTSDDILMIKNGLVTDTSYGNVACYDNGTWTVPKASLLSGCRRQYLLDTNQIALNNIGIEDLLQFQYISIFNALIPLGRIVLPLSNIILP